MVDLTIILPSREPDKWARLYNEISASVGQFSFEVIAVGPFYPPKELENVLNFRYIQEWSCPSRAFMVAATIADSKYISWIPSDCIVFPGEFSECIKLLKNQTKKDGVILRYSEGPGFSGTQHLEDSYWKARTHGDLQLKWIEDGWNIAPLFMYNLEYFREMGGLDCEFYHLNMQQHSFAFKIQKNGGKLFLSPGRVLASDWQPWVGHEGEIMRIAYQTNDAPKFTAMWNGENFPNLDWGWDNWRKAKAFWELRYK